METNELFIKLSGRVPYPHEINLGDDVDVLVGDQRYTYNCVKTEDRDNQDGTIDRIFILKATQE